eukprot:3188152-Rhodomonas_salina.1
MTLTDPSDDDTDRSESGFNDDDTARSESGFNDDDDPSEDSMMMTLTGSVCHSHDCVVALSDGVKFIRALSPLVPASHSREFESHCLSQLFGIVSGRGREVGPGSTVTILIIIIIVVIMIIIVIIMIIIMISTPRPQYWHVYHDAQGRLGYKKHMPQAT